jgi:hypothetical protein
MTTTIYITLLVVFTVLAISLIVEISRQDKIRIVRLIAVEVTEIILYRDGGQTIRNENIIDEKWVRPGSEEAQFFTHSYTIEEHPIYGHDLRYVMVREEESKWIRSSEISKFI